VTTILSGELTLKISILPAVALLAVFCTLPVTAEETGDLKIRFEYGGAPPEPSEVDVNKDVEFCGKNKVMDERLLVNKDNKGIKNVIAYIYTSRRGGSKLDPVPPANKSHTLANDKCRFEPHIIIAQTGDTLVVTNPDAVGHNANFQFIMNTPSNNLIPAGGEKSMLLENAEPTAIPVECNIHPWMKAHVLVLEHPFAAVSDENGDLIIKGVPAGEKLVFRVYHESGKFVGVKVKGSDPITRRNTFEVEIKPGVNDLGTIVMPEVKAE
jgi:plastocyanin